MGSRFYIKDNLLNPLYKYIVSGNIREYDISKANINILLSIGIITEDQYRYYYDLPKQRRAIEVGWLQKDKTIAKALSNGFTTYRQKFFEANDIEDHEVLTIKKDAVYLINKIPQVCKFDNVEFIMKNHYTSFYSYNHFEFYYYYEKANNIELLDIKGIADEQLILHNAYLLDFLKFIFNEAQTQSIDTVIKEFSEFLNMYVSKELELGYYRELNPMSQFRLLGTKITSFMADYLQNDFDRSFIDIQFNENLLKTLLAYYSQIFMSQQKRIRN